MRHEKQRGTVPVLRQVSPVSGGARPPSRRQLFGGGSRSMGAGGAGGGGYLGSSTAIDPLLTLVHRLTPGYTRAEYQLAKSLGWSGYVEYHLNHLAIDDSAMVAKLLPFTSLPMTSKQIYDTYNVMGQAGVPSQELKVAALLRSAFSKRALFERMVEFWTDHFNIDHADGQEKFLKTADDRDVIRAHALGKFPDLLNASAHSGAMLLYLDNYANTQQAPQENYARELMELHALGVDGPYTETDVKEVAKCFTGWGFYGPSNAQYGNFRFLNANHTQGTKTVLGTQITSGGQQDAQAVLDLLAGHPKTADFISRKMIKWLWSETPPQSLVTRVANVYLATGGDIQAMIREIFTQPADVAGLAPPPPSKFRRPFHFYVSLVRALELNIATYGQQLTQLGLLGQVPFAWPAPNGYPDSIYAWGSNLLPRWSAASRMLDNQIPGISVTQTHVTALLNATGAGTVSEQIDQVLTGGRLASDDLSEIQAYVDDAPAPTWQIVREAIALAASSPSFQLY